MGKLKDLRNEISELLAKEEKAYNIPSVCISYGLEPGEESEAYASKRLYVSKRLASKSGDFLLQLARRLIKDYDASELGKVIATFFEDSIFDITNITRKNLLDELTLIGNISGKLELTDFLIRIWPLNQMPSTDPRFLNASGDIWQHMVNNEDWTYQYLFDSYLGLTYTSDEQFLFFLEQVVHPLVRDKDEQQEYVSIINKHITTDGFEMQIVDYISGYPLYRAIKLDDGVKGSVKNLIFAADGPKPEIVLTDSINNDIQIVKNEKYCLIFDAPLPQTGLLWRDLVSWWAEKTSQDPLDVEVERKLYKRLLNSLDSEPERLVFDTYFRSFRQKLSDRLPALIPQVYLHYDPYTIKQLSRNYRLARQRMDFLILFSNQERVVIEIDGKQHYSEGDIASPQKYAEMVSADRELRLSGYEIYRFGGFELSDVVNGGAVTTNFFKNLFAKHRVYF